MSEFVFMLTRNDETVPNARALYDQAAGTAVRHFGCKDIGLPRHELEALLADIRNNRHISYLEVVSETREATLDSARVAIEVGPDFLIGGTFVEPVQEIIAGSDIKFFPYIGRVIDHPCLLRGSIDEIAEDARHVQEAGVDGINLLGYRYDGDVPGLVTAVSAATTLPLICAGSVDSLARVRELSSLGVWAFTVGTAALDLQLGPGAPLETQLEAILETARDGAGVGET
jgi:hypothetical protein